jgi:hypothetical protein
MIITSQDLKDIALLPPDWQQHGTVEDAINALRMSVENAKRPSDVSPFAVSFGADTSRGVLSHAKVLRVRNGRRLLDSDGGPEGYPRIVHAEVDYDVVHRPSGAVIARVRHESAAAAK